MLLIAPNFSNSVASASSSMFQERLPTKRLFCAFSSSSAEASIFDFFAIGVASGSALRFLGAAASSSLSSSEDSDVSEPSLSERGKA